jgi:uncharacterized damage-inducible protein DinB
MFKTISEVKDQWLSHADATKRIFGALTDQSLSQAVTPDGRTLGRMAWHIVQSIPEMGRRTGLQVEGPDEKTPVPDSAEEIKRAYDLTGGSLIQQIDENWNDDSLVMVDDMYGERWTRAFTLYVIFAHEIHHRGQMTVLMRQAGLKVPGVFGPAKEEWAACGMKPPEI